MEYPAEAQKILDILNRTDFKNIKKSEVISLVSKLNDLNPDVAREIIAQFPEVAEMLKVAISEYTEKGVRTNSWTLLFQISPRLCLYSIGLK